jgi:hypothetical protein
LEKTRPAGDVQYDPAREDDLGLVRLWAKGYCQEKISRCNEPFLEVDGIADSFSPTRQKLDSSFTNAV